MSIERTLIGLLLAKIETNYGIDPTPSAGSNIIAVRRSAVKYDQKWTHLERAILDGSLAKLGGLNVLPEIGLSFDVEVRGNRTDGIAADISAAEATTSFVMRVGASKMLHCTIAKRRGL